jgi:arylsulfatase A-like enzyme
LKQAGYRTAHFGKWHLGGGRDVTDAPKFAAYGYDEHAGTYESPEPDPDITATNWIWSPKDKFKRWERTGFFVDKTLDFLRRNTDQPCFVNLWLDDVHSPWIPNEEAQKEKNPNFAKNLKPVLAEMDTQIGRLMAGLKTLEMDDRTLVIFTSDNGPYPHLPGRTDDFRGCKFSLYEGGLRLPFIARWPGVVRAGLTDKTTVLASVDMFPTLCHIAGAELPTDVEFDGIDMSTSLRGILGPRERPLMWEYGRNAKFFGRPKLPDDRSPNLAIRDGDWKLLVSADGENTELYNLASDPSESKNVVEENPEVASRLKGDVLKWRKSMPSTVQAAHSSE